MTKIITITTHATTQVDYQIQNLIQDGREYMVVPVVMLVEGVHNGSAGPILHLQENYGQNPEAWNGVPLTAGHPRNEDGEHTSVKRVDPDQWIVGQVRNALVENGKLKAEAWIDRQRAIAVNPEVVNYLMEGRQLEVSTGMATRDVQKVGQYNDQQYEAVTMEYYPDHLALLPGERGACSWDDGCGIRVNQNNKEEHNGMSNLKDDIKKGLGVHNGLQANKAGFVELSKRVQGMLDRRDSQAQIHFLKEIYEDTFVYEIRDHDQGSQKFFRQEYSFNEGMDDITFEGRAEEVRRNIEYVPLQQNNSLQTNDGACGCTMKRTKFNNNTDTEDTMSDTKEVKQPSGEVMDQVVSLINNERTRFSKTDRSWMLQLNEEQLSKLEPTEAPEPEVTREQALQVLSEDLADTDKLLNVVSEDIKSQVETGIKAYNDKREGLIKKIQANAGDIWTAEKLEDMDTDFLESLEKTSRKTDYSGNGQPVITNTEAEHEEMLLPAGIELKS